ncbi:cold-shock protein [Chloroflexota bacterium]
MAKGTIATLIDRGFGFIKTEEVKDLFFHRSELEGVEFSSLRAGQEVEFEMGLDSKGRSQAVKVRLVEVGVKEELLSAEENTEAHEVVEESSTETP